MRISEEELNAILCALYVLCGFSIHRHVPVKAIKCKVNRRLWPVLKKP